MSSRMAQLSVHAVELTLEQFEVALDGLPSPIVMTGVKLQVPQAWIYLFKSPVCVSQWHSW
jgi:hypothetical protein